MNTITENAARLADMKAELAETKAGLAATMEKLRSLTEESVKKILTMYGQGAPINASMGQIEARDIVMDYMIDAKNIPVHPVICRHMVNVGFDESLITYDDAALGPDKVIIHYEGEDGKPYAGPFGFVDGIPLLKFVGFLNFDAPTLAHAAALMSLGDDDTKH